MKWISNNDQPIYVWNGDTWYNQKDKLTYILDIQKQCWHCDSIIVPFTKKTKVIQDKK